VSLASTVLSVVARPSTGVNSIAEQRVLDTAKRCKISAAFATVDGLLICLRSAIACLNHKHYAPHTCAKHAIHTQLCAQSSSNAKHHRVRNRAMRGRGFFCLSARSQTVLDR
jgi:hypothetical protein